MMTCSRVLLRLLAFGAGLLCASLAQARTVFITDDHGQALPLVMVTQVVTHPAPTDTSDNGYAKSGVLQHGTPEHTAFTDAQGRADLPDAAVDTRVRLRKPGYRDLWLDATDQQRTSAWRMVPQTNAKALAEQRPSNAWTSTLLAGQDDLRKEFLAQCGFCHQQGSAFLRKERSAQEWSDTIARMVRYGSRLSSQAQRELPAVLEAHWKDIQAHPEKVPEATPWTADLSQASITEWPIGDRFSQMHDFVMHSNGMVYVGDNLQDRLYEINPTTGDYTVYRIPPQAGDTLGGLLAGRLRDFPKHETYQGIHSLVEAPADGHIFITPSYQRRLIEFDPRSKSFTYHDIGRGFYPHTVRMDAKNRVWFTLALSNQVAMFDRATQRFTTYDLPFRSVMERVTVALTPFFFKLISWGIPVANWVRIDHVSTGVPLPYGMEITPDGKAWTARLHTNEIASVDPDTGQVTMVPTPLKNPRRLRADRDGNLWISMYSESAVLKYEPATGRFTTYPLPVRPLGSDTPYALNVDRQRHQLWVNGTNSDGVHRLDIATGTWTHFPLPRRATFTRDVEFMDDGRVILSSASFPSWHIEDSQPTLIVLRPQRKPLQPTARSKSAP